MNNKTTVTDTSFTVGDFTILPSRNLIKSVTEEISITPKMLAVLTALAKNQGETLSKEHLIISVWGTIHTSDMVLSRAISDLRKVFGDSARQQHYIETVTKKGYRLKQQVCWQKDILKSQPKPAIKVQNKPVHRPSIIARNITLPPNIKRFFFTSFTIIILIVAAWYASKSTVNITESNIEPNQLTKLTQITKNDDIERNVRFSVDGKYLAYAVFNKDKPNVNIKLHSLVNNKIKVISSLSKDNENYYAISPAFSPNGKELAYKYRTQKYCHIIIYDLVNSQKRKLTDCPYAKTNALDWSPDGRYIVTTVFNYIEKTEGLALVDSTTGKINIFSTPHDKASGYLWPRFSPDGKTIAVVYVKPNDNLWIMGLIDIESGLFTKTLQLGEEISQVIWDSTGKYLYYLIVNSIDNGIWKINLTTNQTHKHRVNSLNI